MSGKKELKKEFGDYQTPNWFTDKVCAYLKSEIIKNPEIVFEPTCGIGNFISSSLNYFNPNKIFGVEINKDYCDHIREEHNQSNLVIYEEDFFSFNMNKITDEISLNDEILIIGNPPWINNSSLSSIDGKNIPTKSNFKKLKGIDAITGGANFDICEFIILQLIEAFKDKNATIAMLCKTSVARNIFIEINKNNVLFELFYMLKFDAKEVFDISADSCVMVIKLSDEKNQKFPNECKILNFNTKEIISKMTYCNGNLSTNFNEIDYDMDGKSVFEWRSGVKHDCSKIMELTYNEGQYINGYGTILDIEDALVFPLIKSSQVKKPIINSSEKYVIVTQKKTKENTEHIKGKYPKIWKYLTDNKETFLKRKSSIYKNAPDFSMFGVGDYSYSNYKVGISGFYKKPLFSLLTSDKPIMMDDTCCFISFDNYDDAYTAMLILNSEKVQKFLLNISFIDSKRPYTKKVLDRIDFIKCLNVLKFEDLLHTEKKLGLENKIIKENYLNFKELLKKESVK